MGRPRDRGAAAARRVADELIERFDVAPFRDRLVKNLSGGERRRVDLAAGLIDRPRVLVLDEPTTGLDPRSRQVVWSTIRELRRRRCDPSGHTRAQFDDTPPRQQRTVSVAALDEAGDLARVAAVVQAAGIGVDEIALRRPTLDDAFLALTGHMATEPMAGAEEAAV